MTNALYDEGREGFLDGSIDWDTDDIRAVLVDAALYTVNLATHKFLSSIPAGARASVSAAFTGKTKVAGVADADDISFTSVPAGPACEAIAIYKHTGADGTARLIAYIDSLAGLPVTPVGVNINAIWSNGTNKIFKL